MRHAKHACPYLSTGRRCGHRGLAALGSGHSTGSLFYTGFRSLPGLGAAWSKDFEMPTGDFDSKPSWADQVEEEGEDDKCVTSELLKGIPLPTSDTSPEPEFQPGDPLLPPKGGISGKMKMVTEYKIEEDKEKFQIVRTLRFETQKASKAVAKRKKFGNSEFDPLGPSVATTTVMTSP